MCNTNMGVIYDERDYAGTLLRISIMLIDLIVVLFFGVIGYLSDTCEDESFYPSSCYKVIYSAFLI
jgi:hypothetical protein